MISTLSAKVSLVFQWVPDNFPLPGNEIAESMAKAGCSLLLLRTNARHKHCFFIISNWRSSFLSFQTREPLFNSLLLKTSEFVVLFFTAQLMMFTLSERN